MVKDKDIVFVTTTLYTKWLYYQKRIIKDLFPESQHIIVDGRGNWPNSWFYWIDEVKNCDQKYFVHIDEDFFITSKEEFMKVFDKMESEDLDLVGCSDGYHHFRGANPVAINTFLMYGKVEHVKNINTDLKSLKYEIKSFDGLYHWVNSADIKMKDSYKDDFNYEHRMLGSGNFNCEQEPYYSFLWSMKDLGCKFGYLYPHFDSNYKSTNPRLNETSEDIGIHMWYTRQWNQEFDVWGLPNRVRYENVEKMILGNKKINIYINVAVVGNVNYVLADLINSIIKSGLYSTCNQIFLIINGDIKNISLNLTLPKIKLIFDSLDISKCEFPTLQKIWNDCQNEDITVLYLHTKGVTKPGNPMIKDWTDYLIHFNILKWQDRFFELKEYDCTGVNLGGNTEDINDRPETWGYGKAPLHYSGNFWWSTSSHIKNLPEPYKWVPDNNYVKWRVMAEMWLCQIKESNYNCAWKSNVNHYTEMYPKNLYDL